jgi:hypothetical protein
VGAHFERKLRTLALAHPLILEVRGAGLMRGIELRVDAAPVIDLARERGLLVNRTAEKVVRHAAGADGQRQGARFGDRHSRRRPRRRGGGGARMSAAVQHDGERLSITPVDGGVTAAAGFRSAAVHAGIKKSTRSILAIIAADRAVAAAGIFTTNLAQARRSSYRGSTSNARPVARPRSSSTPGAPTPAPAPREWPTRRDVHADRGSRRMRGRRSAGRIDRCHRRGAADAASRGGHCLGGQRLTRGKGSETAHAIMTTDPFPKERAVRVDTSRGAFTVGGPPRARA